MQVKQPRAPRRRNARSRLAIPLAVAALLAVTGTAGAAEPSAAASGAAGPKGPGHVAVIVIENKSFQEAYVDNPNPYLRSTLPKQGQLLTQYYGSGHLSLTNYIALLSGQAPNVATQSDCQQYMDFAPAAPAVPAAQGQVTGAGCVYPASVKAFPDQLSVAGVSWKGYLEDMGKDLSREPDRCGEPGNPVGVGSKDGTQSATAKDQYAARHNPFVYFHSILDSPRCNTNVVPLDQLTGDLASTATTPSFSLIAPNLCNDGHDATCKGKNLRGTNAGGLTAVDYWLSTYVPRILNSPAFRQDGVVIITSDESENQDAAACCGEKPGPNTLAPGQTGPGGGRIGTLVIGSCVVPGTRNATAYNHYSLLRSLEDRFGVRRGGSDGKGHLGFAGQAGLRPFGTDVFGRCAAPGVGAPNPGASGGPNPGASGGQGGSAGNGGSAGTGDGTGTGTGTGTGAGQVVGARGTGSLPATGKLPPAALTVGLLGAGVAAVRLRRRAATTHP